MLSVKSLIILILLAISLPSEITFIGSMLLISLYLTVTERAAGAVKALLLLTLRSIMNPGVAAGLERFSLVKWALIFALVIYGVIKTPRQNDRALSKFELCLGAYTLMLIAFSILRGSYPVVSAFKLFSWSFVFGGVVYIINANRQIDWIDYMTKWLNLLLFFSILLLPLRVGYLKNGHAFQGLTNQPNMLGALCGLTFICNLLRHNERAHGRRGASTAKKVFFCLLCLGFCYLSESRTGLISILITTLYAIAKSRIPRSNKYGIYIALGALVAVALASNYFSDLINSFIVKGHSENLLYSRGGQIESFSDRFMISPLMGTGFMTPFEEGVRSFAPSFDMPVEPGNLVFALLSQTGIIGTLGFAALYIYLFKRTIKGMRALFVIPFVLSLGEMMFFSTNNIAIFYYVILACTVRFDTDTSRVEPRRWEIEGVDPDGRESYEGIHA